jgi:superfamily II DNA or RNA helicase
MYLISEKVPEVRYGYAESRGVSMNQRRAQYRKVVNEQVYTSKTRNRMILDFCDYAWDEVNASCAVITDSIPHIQTLCKMDPKMVGVHGKTPAKERKAIWERLKRREITRVATTLMDEAVNIQSLGSIAYAAPGRSKVSLVQRQRQLRTFEGQTAQGYYKKEFGLVYFPYDTTDFLKSQSSDNLDVLRSEFINAHAKCKYFDLGEYGK